MPDQKMSSETAYAPAEGARPAIRGLRSETVAIGGVRLHYWIGGPANGRPVLLWHGFLATGYAWHDVAPALVEAGYAVLVPDMRGYGDSDKPAGTAGYDARALAEEFRALVTATGFGGGRPIILAAHDMGGPPALIWAADHPAEVAGLLYMEAPVMLGDILEQELAFNRRAMAHGSKWWWVLPLAPGVSERLIVGNERAFLNWFYQGAPAHPEAIAPAVIDEYLRTFNGPAGVLGALGVYRAVFDSVDQTEPLLRDRVRVPVVALGGAKAQGDRVGKGVARLAEDVQAETVEDCGHFIPDEQPGVVIRHIKMLAARTTTQFPAHAV